jgi:hypothetical protein
MNHLDSQEAYDAEVEYLVENILTTLDHYDGDTCKRLCPGCRRTVVLNALKLCLDHVEAQDGPMHSGGAPVSTPRDLN